MRQGVVIAFGLPFWVRTLHLAVDEKRAVVVSSIAAIGARFEVKFTTVLQEILLFRWLTHGRVRTRW